MKLNWTYHDQPGRCTGIQNYLRSIGYLKMERKEDQMVNSRNSENSKKYGTKGEHREMAKNQVHRPHSITGLAGVLELQEEEEEEVMDPVVPVEMKNQTGRKVKILRKKIIVVWPLQE